MYFSFLLKSFCLPLLFELWSPPQSTVLLLERALNKALCTIIRVPVHAPMLGIHLLLGTILVNLLLKFHRLSFLMNTLHLPPTAPALHIFKSRLHQSGSLMWVTTVFDDLKLLFLSSIEDLVITPPSKASWGSHIKLSLYSYFYITSFNTDLVPFRLTDTIHLIPQDP